MVHTPISVHSALKTTSPQRNKPFKYAGTIIMSQLLIDNGGRWLFYATLLIGMTSLVSTMAILSSGELTPLTQALFAIFLTSTICSHIWLWQYSFHPDWRPWGILLTVIISLVSTVHGYLSTKPQTPEVEAFVKGILISASIDATFQIGSAACFFLSKQRAYEPLVRSTAVFSWRTHMRPPISAQGTEFDEIQTYPEDSLQLGSLYQAHERLRKGSAGKLPEVFAPVSHQHPPWKENAN